MRLMLALCLSLFLSGCFASGFEENYRPEPQYPAYNYPVSSPAAGLQTCLVPHVHEVRPGYNMDMLVRQKLSEGYVLIGRARWKSTSDESDSTALEQGRKVGACLVLWQRLDAGQIHTTRTVGTYVPEKKVKIYRKGPYGKESITVVEPAQTYYRSVPVTYQQYDFTGLFFAKRSSLMPQGEGDAFVAPQGGTTQMY